MTVQLHDSSDRSMRKDANAGRLVSDMAAEHQEWLDGQPTSTSCFFCDWTIDGTAAECREAARVHREKEHPGAANRLGRRRAQSKPKHQRSDAENEQAGREAVEARRVRAERENAALVAKVEAARQREALAAMDAGEPQDREEEPLGPHLDAESPEPQPADSPPPRDESGLEETPAAEDASPGVADVSSSPTTHDEGTPMEASTNGRAKKWPRERVIAAIQHVAAEIGGTPSIAQMVARGYTFAPSCTKLGLPKWTELVVEAGLPPNTRGGDTRSGREPTARTEGPPTQPAQRVAAAEASEQPSRPEHSLVVVAELRDPIRTADIPYDAEILEDEADFLRQRAAALDQIAAGVRALAATSRRDALDQEELAA